jgi:hypothetical protein
LGNAWGNVRQKTERARTYDNLRLALRSRSAWGRELFGTARRCRWLVISSRCAPVVGSWIAYREENRLFARGARLDDDVQGEMLEVLWRDIDASVIANSGRRRDPGRRAPRRRLRFATQKNRYARSGNEFRDRFYDPPREPNDKHPLNRPGYRKRLKLASLMQRMHELRARLASAKTCVIGPCPCPAHPPRRPCRAMRDHRTGSCGA